MKSRQEIKQEAKMLIRTGQVSPLLVSAIVIAVQFVLNEVTTFLQYGGLSIGATVWELFLSGDIESLDAFLSEVTPHPATTFVSILTTLVMIVLNAGYCSCLIGISRRQTMPYSSLGDGLPIAGKVIWCQILMAIKIALWSLLLFVPAIIAAYRYRFAIYNLIDNPELSASEAIALSCRQTHGLKWSLFVLDISMLGWNLLSSVTRGLAGLWVQPYILLCDLHYYNMARTLATPHTDPRNDFHSPHDTPWEF